MPTAACLRKGYISCLLAYLCGFPRFDTLDDVTIWTSTVATAVRFVLFVKDQVSVVLGTLSLSVSISRRAVATFAARECRLLLRGRLSKQHVKHGRTTLCVRSHQ